MIILSQFCTTGLLNQQRSVAFTNFFQKRIGCGRQTLLPAVLINHQDQQDTIQYILKIHTVQVTSHHRAHMLLAHSLDKSGNHDGSANEGALVILMLPVVLSTT